MVFEVISYTAGDTQGLETFLCVFACMCIFGAVRDPNGRYYSKKTMASWTAIFSHDVCMIPCVEFERLGQGTATMAARYTPQSECQLEATGTVTGVDVSAIFKSGGLLIQRMDKGQGIWSLL